MKHADLHFRIPPELHEVLRRRAFEERRSMREIIVQALTEKFLKQPTSDLEKLEGPVDKQRND